MSLSANWYPPSDQVRGHASPRHALAKSLLGLVFQACSARSVD
jgi:hypothetical protein